jgi:peptidoglycan/LPS O-acetylase OafA/YrhL
VTEQARERYPLLDAVRGVAALAVVAYHFGGFFALAGQGSAGLGSWAGMLTGYGWLGVQVFFALSGFVIALAAPPITSPPTSAGRFLLRRLIRVTPPYWASVVATVALWVVALAMGQGRREYPLSAGMVFSHLVYAQAAFGYPPLQDIYWTLALEIQFYLLFALILLVRSASRVAAVGVFLVLTTGSLAAGFAGYNTNDWFVSHWHGFALGVLAFRAGKPGAGLGTFVVTLGAVLALGIYRERVQEMVLAATAVGLLLAARTGGMARWPGRWLPRLGKISYSLYVFHALVGGFVFFRLRPWLGGSDLGVCAIIAVATIASFATAVLSYRFVERPATRLSHRIRIT